MPGVPWCWGIPFVQEARGWRQPYLDFLQHRLLPSNHTDVMKIVKVLYRRRSLILKRFNQAPLRCIAGDEVVKVLKEVHSKDCDEHWGGSRLFKKIMHLGYYWPTMEADAVVTRKCQTRQFYSNQIHAQTTELHSLSTHWPFHIWGFDLLGPINPPSRGLIWTLAARECYTKWVETIALKWASGAAMASFIRKNVIFRFANPN